MKKNYWVFLILSTFLLYACGGSPNTLIINSSTPPMPAYLKVNNRNLSNRIGQTITESIPQGSGACIFALFPTSGSFISKTINFPPPSMTMPSPSVTYTYNVDSANSQPIAFSYHNGLNRIYAPTIFQSGVMGIGNKDVKMDYAGQVAPSWHNETALTPPYTTAVIPDTKIETWFTFGANVANNQPLRYVSSALVNVNTAGAVPNKIAIQMVTRPFDDCSLPSSLIAPYTIAEVMISHQPFGVARRPWMPIPSNTITALTAVGEMNCNIPLPQPNVYGLKGTRPEPGIYHVLMFLKDASGNYQATVEVTNAFVSLRIF